MPSSLCYYSQQTLCTLTAVKEKQKQVAKKNTIEKCEKQESDGQKRKGTRIEIRKMQHRLGVCPFVRLCANMRNGINGRICS